MSLHYLLGLPPCLRRQVLLDSVASKRIYQCNVFNISRRTFGNSHRALRPTKPIPKHSRKQPVKKASPSPTPETSLTPPNPPPAVQRLPKPLSYAEKLFSLGDEILIYKSPSHRSFFIASYVTGGLLLFGAWNWTMLTNYDLEGGERRVAWYIRVVEGIPLLFLAIASTAMILAPSKIIRSITVLSPAATATGRPMLRCEINNSIPFLKRKPFLVAPSEAYLNRRVNATEDLSFRSVPFSEAAAFTSDKHPFARQLPQDRGLWTSLQRDTRRMFLREGFAYLRTAEDGNWKLDLRGCEVLDWGKPLDGLTMPDTRPGVGPVAMLKRYLLSR